MAAVTRDTRRQPGRRVEHEPFPVIPLKDVAAMARVISARGGRCRFDELAGALGQTKGSGAFRQKTAAGRMLGVAETEGSDLVLTGLGRRLSSPGTEAEALVEAFLHVSLYASLYDRYAADGGKLPSNEVIQEDLKRLGVPAHNAQKARQVFLRCAEDAGFFRSGRDRLIRPSAGSGTMSSRHSDAPEPRKPTELTHREAGRMADHPLVKALVDELPPKDQPPTPAQLKHFLDTMKMNLETIYGLQGDEGGQVAPRPNPNGAATAQQQPSWQSRSAAQE